MSDLPGPEPTSDPPAWRHFHPLSPLVKGGVAVLAVGSYVVSQQFDKIIGSASDDPTEGHRTYAALIVLGVVLVIVAAAWVTWLFSRFRLTDTLVEVRTGLFFRQHRQIRYDRIQAVDIARPVLARLVGLSEVLVQSAGGSESHVRLSFLAQSDARTLRDRIADLAVQGRTATGPGGRPGVGDGGVGDGGGDGGGGGGPVWPGAEQPPAAPSLGPAVTREGLIRVPTVRLVLAALYSPAGAFLALTVPVLVVGLAIGEPRVVGWLAPVILGVGGHHVRRLISELNFVLDSGPVALRVRHGLTELRASTVPLHRIQAVELRQPAGWRPVGWWRVEVNVAGVGHHDDDGAQSTLLPVGTLAEALEVLGLAVGELPPALAAAAATGSGPAGGFTTAPAAARVLDPISWRRLGYAVTPQVLVLRAGRLSRRFQVVPHARIQSLRLAQGPVQRARGLASVALVSTPGPVAPAAPHLAVVDAHALLAQQSRRSTLARVGSE